MNNKPKDPRRYTPDGRKSPTYQSWCNMKTRCLNTNNDHQRWYANIGIDPRWLDFDNFYDDMGERPVGHTLDRKDGSKGYSKDNCKWSTQAEQVKNRDCVTLVTIDGEELPLAVAAKKLGLSKSTVQHRFKNQNKTAEEALQLV